MAEQKLTPGRLEAFSDGVIAVIITIMVLELKVPGHEMSNIEGLHHVVPLLFIYLLSFIMVGIYWINHHYMIEDVQYVTHGLLWSNLIFLFTLSLIPFATNWVGERGISSFSIALYAISCTLPAITWFIVANIICNTSRTKESSGGVLKQIASFTFYIGAAAMAYVSPYIAIAMIAAVDALWLIPPKRVIEQTRQHRRAASMDEPQ